jgi:hypothetical protein
MDNNEWSAGMDSLFQQAETEGKWFHCSYQDLWFSPSELKGLQETGRFRWGAVNWTLRDPKERSVEVERRVTAAQADLENIKRELTDAS